jgi:hypothetical protein
VDVEKGLEADQVDEVQGRQVQGDGPKATAEQLTDSFSQHRAGGDIELAGEGQDEGAVLVDDVDGKRGLVRDYACLFSDQALDERPAP